MTDTLTPEILLRAYSEGYFPMASSKHGRIYWHSPEERAVFPLKSIRLSKSMRKLLEKNVFRFSINNDFNYVIQKCSEREDTWISDEVISAYSALHEFGYAHSIEAWQDGKICGGLYGVAIGAAFFGESMFNDVSNASKASFYFLINHLLRNEFILLDSQYINSFTEQLGAIEIPREDYLAILKTAVNQESRF